MSLCPAMNVDFCVPAALFLVQVLCIVYVSHNKKKREREKIFEAGITCFYSSAPPILYALYPPYPSFPTLWKRSPPLIWFWGGRNSMWSWEGRLGWEGRWKRGEVKRRRKKSSLLLGDAWLQSEILDARIPMGRKHLPTYSPSSSPALGWAQTKNLPPYPSCS